MVAGMRREPPLRIFLSHTSELREHPREWSYVAAAEAAVMRAGHAISNMANFAARDTEPADYCVANVARNRHGVAQAAPSRRAAEWPTWTAD